MSNDIKHIEGENKLNLHIIDFRWVPSWARPYAGGSVSVGDGVVGVHWDFNSFLNDQQGWWTGPHVCSSRTVVNTTDVSADGGGDMLMTHRRYRSVQCDHTNTAYRCVTT